MFARRGLNSSAATDEWVGQRVKGLTWVDSVTILVCPGTDRPGAGEFQRIQLPLRLLAARRSAPDHPGAEGHGHLCGGRDPTARPSRRLCCKKKCGPGPQHWGVGQGPETMIARPLSLGHWGVPASDFRPGEPGNTCQGHIGVAPPPPPEMWPVEHWGYIQSGQNHPLKNSKYRMCVNGIILPRKRQGGCAGPVYAVVTLLRTPNR